MSAKGYRAVAVVVLMTLAGWLGVAQATMGPQEVVQTTTDQLLEAIQTERDAIQKDPQKIYQIVEKIALPHFDFERISRWVLAKNWRKATPEQRARFEDEFTTLLVHTYATALAEYKGQKVTMEPLRMKEGDTQVKVRAKVEQPGGFPIPIDYRMHLKDGEWKVYDVAIDNISLVANYRTSFANEISTGGIDNLIATLATRNKSGNAAAK